MHDVLFFDVAPLFVNNKVKHVNSGVSHWHWNVADWNFSFYLLTSC